MRLRATGIFDELVDEPQVNFGLVQFGHHPLWAFVDHGSAGTGESWSGVAASGLRRLKAVSVQGAELFSALGGGNTHANCR